MRIGVVGLGRVGVMHARNLARTGGVDEVILIGRHEDKVSAARADVEAALAPGAPVAIAGEHIPPGDAALISSTSDPLPEVIQHLDGIVIATSTSSHPELVRLTARAGIPTLIEKPLALDVDALTQLANELDETGTPVMVAFHRRYDPAHQDLMQRIGRGDLGTLRVIHAVGHDHHPLPLDYIPRSGGMWLDMLVHEFDAIPWITGERVVRVHATGSVLDEPSYREFDDVDTAVALLTLESGAIAAVSGTRRNGAGQDVRLEIFGSAGSFAAGLEPRTPISSTEPGVAPPPTGYDMFIDRFERAFRSEASHFVRLVQGEATNLTPPRAGVEAIRIAIAAGESRRLGVPVDLITH